MVTSISPRAPGVTARDVREIDEFLAVLVGQLDQDAVPACEAFGLWSAFDAVERRAGAAKTLLARRVEDAGGWKRDGFRSAAEQLAIGSGTSVRAAKHMLETSQQVKKLPKTAHALRNGRLSGAKARVIAAAAAVQPDAEDRLLELPEQTPFAEVHKQCLEARAGDDRDAGHQRIHDERTAREYVDGEGAWNFHARGTGAYAFGALIELAGRATGHGATGAGTAKKTPAQHMVLVRVDHSALVRGTVLGDEICEICGLGPIPVWIARKILGDAVVKLVITKGVDVANVTHLGRGATIAQQVALSWKQSACTVLGCTRTRRLQNDHRYEWIKTKRTRVDELDPLCKHHHDLKTYNNWALIQGTGPRQMVPPTDPHHPRNRPPPRRD